MKKRHSYTYKITKIILTFYEKEQLYTEVKKMKRGRSESLCIHALSHAGAIRQLARSLVFSPLTHETRASRTQRIHDWQRKREKPFNERESTREEHLDVMFPFGVIRFNVTLKSTMLQRRRYWGMWWFLRCIILWWLWFVVMTKTMKMMMIMIWWWW